jgi:hypothetical protein
MSLASPLSQIINVLTETEALAQQHKELLQQNAQATQAALVEPVLRALGWNCNDPRYVRRNLSFHDLELDYALYDDDGTICSLIKVTTLNEDLYSEQLHEPLQVLAEYQDIDYVILANGSAWQFLRPSEEGFLEFFSEIDYQRMQAEQSAQRLITLLDICNFWRIQQSDQLTHIHNLIAELQGELNAIRQIDGKSIDTKVIAESPSKLIAEVQPSTQAAVSQPRTRRRKAHVDVKQSEQAIDLESLEFIPLQELGNVQGKKPQALRLPTGEVIAIRSWKELLIACCHLTLEHNQDLPIPLPDKAGKKVSLFQNTPPKEGLSFEEADYQGQIIFIYTNYDANNQVMNAIHILEYLPAELKQVEAAAAFRN